jgi:hypothetical protein
MEEKRIPYYLGIDLNDRYAVLSFYQLNSKEPDTVSTVAGSEIYQIPLVLAKRKGLGQWYYGEDARKMAKNSEMICVDALLRRAMDGETLRIEDETFSAEELLALFLKKLVQIPQKLGNPIYFDRLVVTVERLSRDNMELFWRLAHKMGLSRDQFMVIDHRESFYYFALSQQESLWRHDVFLFEYDQTGIFYYALNRDMRTRPQVVSIWESSRQSIGENRDADFLRLQQKAFENRIVSSAYLVGEGFDGDWMKDSLTNLCRGRRAFMGKNLYSKGACYAALVRDREADWPYIYMGENEMKFNVSLKVMNRGNLEFYNLIPAGRNWFEIFGECEVILSGAPTIDFWKQLPRSRDGKIETLELTDLTNRPDRATRLRITGKPVSDDKVAIEIRDMGFGELFRSTDKTWKYTMSM